MYFQSNIQEKVSEVDFPNLIIVYSLAFYSWRRKLKEEFLSERSVHLIFVTESICNNFSFSGYQCLERIDSIYKDIYFFFCVI